MPRRPIRHSEPENRSGTAADVVSVPSSDAGNDLNRKHFPYSTIFLLIPLLALVRYGWFYTWDDSAIALGFSKGIAFFHALKPTELSEIVEGYSNFLWIVLWAPFFGAGLSDTRVFQIMRATALLINLVNVFLVVAILNRRVNSRLLIWLGSAVFAFSSITMVECLNGMEGPLELLLILTSWYAYVTGRRRWFALTSSLLILVRIEAAFYLVSYVLLYLFERRNPLKNRVFWLWAGVFAIFHSWRYVYFGQLVSNTIRAKAGLPFTPRHNTFFEWIAWHSKPLIALLKHNLPIVLFVLVAFFLFRRTANSSAVRFRLDIIGLTVALGFFMNFVIGPNYGPQDRMVYPVLPFMIVLLMEAVDRYSNTSASPRLAAALAIVCFAGFAAINLRRYKLQLADPVTVSNVAAEGRRVEALRQANGSRTVVYAGPDVGGIVLYNRNLRLIDTAKLCNRKLAREGYSIFRGYIFDEVKPDIIESHTTWTEASGFDVIPEGVRDYDPVLVNGVPFYVRKGFCPANRLKRISRVEFIRGAKAFPYDQGMYPIDRRSFDRFTNFYSFR